LATAVGSFLKVDGRRRSSTDSFASWSGWRPMRR